MISKERKNELTAESRRRYPEHTRARQAVKQAVASGKLVRPDACERCEVKCRPEGSHDDYSKPLQVEWLCRPCHVKKDLPTACRHGHEYTPENTSWQNDGSRRCRTCNRIKDNRSKAQKREGQARLNVNISDETDAVLREVAERHGITITEAVGRVVSAYKMGAGDD